MRQCPLLALSGHGDGKLRYINGAPGALFWFAPLQRHRTRSRVGTRLGLLPFLVSAIGTKRTFRVALHMSAIGTKADMAFCDANVCFLIQVDI